MLGIALSLSLAFAQKPPGSPESADVRPEVRELICEPLPDLTMARNSELYLMNRNEYGPRWSIPEQQYNRIPRDQREELTREALIRGRLRAIADFPRLGDFIVGTLNRYGAGESGRVVLDALQARICH